MLKNFFKNSLNSLTTVVFFILIILGIQFMLGARIVYFLPDYPITKQPSDILYSGDIDPSSGPYYGYDKCYFYGSCFNLDHPHSFGFMAYLLFFVTIFYAARAGGEKKVWRRVLGLLFSFFSYFIISLALTFDWFGSCSDFCGFDFLFFNWIFLFVAFYAGYRRI